MAMRKKTREVLRHERRETFLMKQKETMKTNRIVTQILLQLATILMLVIPLAGAENEDHYVSAVSRISIYHQYQQMNSDGSKGTYWNYIKTESYWDCFDQNDLTVN